MIADRDLSKYTQRPAFSHARQFYETIGLKETSSGDWELSPQAAERFLERLERRRRM